MADEKTLLEQFVKSFFNDQNSLPYAYISQHAQSFILENKLNISKLLKKYIKKRYKKLEVPIDVKKENVKRSKNEIGVVKNIIDEYLWLCRMLSTFRKIFYMCDFTKFHKKINDNINLIVQNNQEDLVNELSSIILEYEFMKDDPKYAVAFTKSDRLFVCSSKFEYIVLAFDLLKTIESGEEIISRITKLFVDSWIENAVTYIDDLTSLDLRIKSLRKNVLLEDHIYTIEKEIITKLFTKISQNYLLNCVGFQKDINSLEYYYDLIDGKQTYIEIVNNYINIRLDKKKQESINLDKVNQYKKKLEEAMGNDSFGVTIEKLNNLVTSKQIVMSSDQQKFITLFSFWLETLSCRSSESACSEIMNSGFERFVNKDELNVIRYASGTLDDILTNKTNVIDYFVGVAQRELENLDTLFYETSLFDDQDVKDQFLCPYLLSPTDIVLDEFSNDLEEADRDSFLKRSLYKFVGDVFNIIKDKDTFENHLREKLSLRLFTESSSIQDEEDFISCLKMNISRTVYSKLETIISDYRDRFIFKNAEIMLLRRFQWPDFKSLSVRFEDLDKLKTEYSQYLLLNERKSVKWLDTLTTCDVEIDMKPFRLSLIQYKMIMNLSGGENVFNENMTKEEQDVYKIHLMELVKKKLVILKGECYEINYDAPGSDCVPRQVFLRGMAKDQNVEDGDKFEKAILDCQIMKVCKAKKNISIEDLRSLVGCELDLLHSRIEECRKKGYLDIAGNLITYVP